MPHTQARSKALGGDPNAVTRTQQDKAVTELSRSVRDTEREAAVTEARLRELGLRRGEMTAQLGELDAAVAAARDEEEGLKEELGQAVQHKYRLLLATVSAGGGGRCMYCLGLATARAVGKEGRQYK